MLKPTSHLSSHHLYSQLCQGHQDEWIAMVVAGDRQWEDACFCHSCHRTAAEKRGEAEEDAGVNQDLTAWQSLTEDGGGRWRRGAGFWAADSEGVISSTLCRSVPWWSRPLENWPFRSARWCSASLRNSHSSRKHRSNEWNTRDLCSVSGVWVVIIAASVLHHWVDSCRLWFAGRRCWLVAVTR